MNPIYRFDKLSGIHWLEFDGKPEQSIIDLLKKEGWRWSGYRKQWRTNRRFATVPQGIEYTDGGECDYSSERSDRLQNAADRASNRSEEAYARSNHLVENIPFGQPILVGHHSQRGHERTLEKSRSAMDTSVKEQKKAEHLEYKARSSARHQAYKERPDVIARRIKRLKGEIVTIRHQMAYEPFNLYTARKEGDTAKVAEIMAGWEADNQVQEGKIRIIEAEIAENEQALAEAGGLVADNLDIQVGDVIRGRWQGLNEVVKINTRNGEVLSYTCKPLENTWCKKYIIPKTDVRGLAIRKDDMSSDTTALLHAKFEEKLETYAQALAKEEKPAREFKAATVETVNLYNNTTSVFLTPAPLADELVRSIPAEAHLILEPSAGVGTIAEAIRKQRQDVIIHCCEILPQFRGTLEKRGFHVVGENFLEYWPKQSDGRPLLYNAIVGNPPFNGTEWMDHVEHMLELLKEGGSLNLILPQGFVFRQDKRIVAFRQMVEEHGYWQELPRDAFSESGTNVATVMVSVRKPGSEAIETVEEEAEPVQFDLFSMDLSTL